ncbi:MAG: hypothetical protein ACJATI_000773 [Halioglobus sp.]|jgi:hypothetical protein
MKLFFQVFIYWLKLSYYYKRPKLIKQGKQANNLSSAYFGFGGRLGKSVYKSNRAFTSALRYQYQL